MLIRGNTVLYLDLNKSWNKKLLEDIAFGFKHTDTKKNLILLTLLQFWKAFGTTVKLVLVS